MTSFTPIKRWPDQKHHLRNIEISLEVSSEKTYGVVASIYGVSKARVAQVYRVLAGMLCEREFNVPFIDAVYSKQWCRHDRMHELMKKYHSDYISFMVYGNKDREV